MTKIRIDKILSNLGYGSRKEIKAYAKEGRVKLNGEVIKDVSTIIDPLKEELYYLDTKVIYKENIYLMMNKPQNFVSATEDNFHNTVIDILKEKDKAFEPFPVGRLDIDTEGLLIITSDGKFAHGISSPKKHVPKIYYVEIDGELTQKSIDQVEKGILLENEGYKTLPGKLEILEVGKSKTFCNITIMEGKFHQIKRMMIALGCNVTYLKRVQIGRLKLDESLELGEYRDLTVEEIKILKGE